MHVKLNRRLGQNDAGDTVEYSDDEAQWLMVRGYATNAEKAPAKSAAKGESTSGKGSDQAQGRRR